MTTERASLLIEKWFGNNHPLAAQMLAMLIDKASEGEILHDINYQDEFQLDAEEPFFCPSCGQFNECACQLRDMADSCLSEPDYWDGDDSHQEG